MLCPFRLPPPLPSFLLSFNSTFFYPLFYSSFCSLLRSIFALHFVVSMTQAGVWAHRPRCRVVPPILSPLRICFCSTLPQVRLRTCLCVSVRACVSVSVCVTVYLCACLCVRVFLTVFRYVYMPEYSVYMPLIAFSEFHISFAVYLIFVFPAGSTIHYVLQTISPFPLFIRKSLSNGITAAILFLIPVIDTTTWDYLKILVYSFIFRGVLEVMAFFGGFPPEQPVYFHGYMRDVFHTR